MEGHEVNRIVAAILATVVERSQEKYAGRGSGLICPTAKSAVETYRECLAELEKRQNQGDRL